MAEFNIGIINVKRWLAFGHDLLWVPVAILLAYWFRFNLSTIPLDQHYSVLVVLLVAMPAQATAFWLFGLYRGIWRFASIPDLMRILKAVSGGVAVTFLLLFLVNRLEGIPRSVMVLYPVFLTMGLTGPRLIYRWFRDHRIKLDRQSAQCALILGGGQAGEMLVRDLQRQKMYQPVGILDDDPDKLGREIHGVRVRG